MIIQYEALHKAIVKTLLAKGMNEKSARLVADEIVFAEARGKMSHGLNMLDSIIKNFSMQPNAKIQVVNEDLTSCLIDGCGVVGPVVASYAMDKAIEKASIAGISIVGVRNPSPFLTAGYNAWRAAKDHNMVTISMSVSKNKVAPFGSTQAILGTNPIGFGFPADPYPIILDMAISKISSTDLEIAAKEKRLLPEHVAYNSNGQETTDPIAAKDGALISFGDHKGSAIGVIVELMAGALLNAKCGLRADAMRAMLFIAINGNIFVTIEIVKQLAAQLREDVHSISSGQTSTAWMPGDRAEELYRRALSEGLNVAESALAELDYS